MSGDPSFEHPVITDEDISKVAKLLGLPSNAFIGEDGTDPRKDVLKSMKPIDIAACPGSGKTTLLVAKLAILAEEWQYRTRGICVLSHTNAARHEIETRLGHTTVGRRLLTYPHYIGTIHKFVNDFLALPWLRSKGYPVKMIDDVIVEKQRRRLLQNDPQFSGLRIYVEKKEQYQNLVAGWTVSSPDFCIHKNDGRPMFKNPCRSKRQLEDLAKRVVCMGYHRHDEMFMWAGDLMNNVPIVIEALRDRFPLLFIDEAQDNSEEQSAILHRIFMSGDDVVIRQRFGDANQAIFDFVEAQEATTDKFPIDSRKRDLPNSHRFGQKIADLADPLGLVPYCLKGHGPKKRLKSGAQEGQHTIFLFDDDNADKVLDAYGDLLVETFSNRELSEGTFTAVGQRHTPPEKEEKHKFPHHVAHYWPCYDPELSRQEPNPQTFAQYVFAGLGKSQMAGETYLAVEKIADGILRLAGMAEGGGKRARRKYRHRYILELIEEHTDMRQKYVDLVTGFAFERNKLTKTTWNDNLCDVVRSIAETIAGESLSNSEANGFLEWKDRPEDSMSPPIAQRSQDNIYDFSKKGKEVFIRVGSVHSVKGETHTATLVLETFRYKHNLESIKDWLCGAKRGYTGQSDRIRSCLRIHYVAMTRATHLLCLAMKRSTFDNDKDGFIKQLEARGWQVRELSTLCEPE